MRTLNVTDDPSDPEFPIPMRGNEIVRSVSSPSNHGVSNPHEG